MKNIPKKRALLLFFLFFTLLCKGQVESRGANLVSNDSTKSEMKYDKKYALLIGINEYDPNSGFRKLNYAKNDAEALQDILISKCGYAPQDITLLTDKAATQENIINALTDYTKKTGISRNSQLLVYFAGHGTTTGQTGASRTGFLVPFDGNDVQLETKCISMDVLNRLSAQFIPKHVLFLVDACYGGLAQRRDGLSKILFKNVWKEKGSEIITAGSAEETVLEAAEWQHSAFMKVLIDAIKNEKADLLQDKVLTTTELFLYIQSTVPFYAEEKKGKQTPQLDKYGLSEGTFLLELAPNALSSAKIEGFTQKEEDIRKKLNSTVSINTNVPLDKLDIVLINDKYTQTTPVSSNVSKVELAPGFYNLEIRKDKYEPLSHRIVVKPDSNTTVDFILAKKIFDLKIQVQPTDANIIVNGLEKEPQKIIELEKGRHSISIEKRGYIPQKQLFSLLKDSTFVIKLDSIKASIEINTSPNDAILKVDGIVNNNKTFELGFGNHEVEVSKEDYLPKKIKIDVNEPLKVLQNVNLEFNPNGRLGKKIVLEYWNKKALSNIGLSTLSLLGYLYFDNAVKENKLNTTFLNQTQNQKSRSMLQTGKYTCLLFCGMELVNSAFSIRKALIIKKRKSNFLSANINYSPTNVSLCLKF